MSEDSDFYNRHMLSRIYYKNMVIWLIGFVANRVFLKMDLLIGSTISCIIVVILVKILAEKLIKD